jgi:hypothetical protein
MKRCVWILGMLLLTTAVAAPSSGVIVRSAALKENPAFGSKSLTSLAPGARVLVLERQGGWENVSLQASPNVKGWVRTYEVRTDIEPGENPQIVKNKGSDDGVLGGLAGLSRASTGLFGGGRDRAAGKNDNSVVATIGVRGLSETDLKKARPNPAELEKLHGYSVDATAAREYARAGRLQNRDVAALAEVEPDRMKKRKQ